MPERMRNGRSLRVQSGQPLIGVVVREDGQQVTHYFTDAPREVDLGAAQRRVQKALKLAGAWKDLDWDEMEQALDRIRHQ